jgi:hypothetical protein
VLPKIVKPYWTDQAIPVTVLLILQDFLLDEGEILDVGIKSPQFMSIWLKMI